MLFSQIFLSCWHQYFYTCVDLYKLFFHHCFHALVLNLTHQQLGMDHGIPETWAPDTQNQTKKWVKAKIFENFFFNIFATLFVDFLKFLSSFLKSMWHLQKNFKHSKNIETNRKNIHSICTQRITPWHFHQPGTLVLGRYLDPSLLTTLSHT